MGTLYTESLESLIKQMANGKFIRARYIRRAIDNEQLAKNWLQLDKQYVKRYKAVKKAIEATDKRGKQQVKNGRGSFWRFFRKVNGV